MKNNKRVVNKKFTVILLVLICNVAISQTGWFLQTSQTTKNIQDIFFINSQTGWACGDSGKIIKTTNGGTNWLSISPFTANNLFAIRFSDANFGYVTGGEGTANPFCIDNDILAKTTNGGETWVTLLSNSTWDKFYDLAVLNKDTVFSTYAGTDQYCMSSSGGVYKTFNSGSNGTYSYGGWVKGITFINSSTGWFSIFGIGDVLRGVYVVYKTTNTGVNWNAIYADTSSGGSTIGKIRFVDANNGFCLYRMLRKTTNGGVNWQKIDSATTYNIRNFAFANKDTLWLAKFFSVSRTNNGGTNWTQQLTTGTPLNSIYFFDKNTGWVVGDGGIIYKTITGGLTDVRNTSTEVPSSYSLSQNYPNPFNPTTNVQFSIIKVHYVILKIYDILGREAATLVNEKLSPGTYSVDWNASQFPSSVYFYKLQTEGYTQTRKMLLIR